MHEGDSRDGDAQIRPAGPVDRPAPAAGTGAPGWFRVGLTYLVVAALSTMAGVGATRAVQHLTAPGPAATGMPRAAAADRARALTTTPATMPSSPAWWE